MAVSGGRETAVLEEVTDVHDDLAGNIPTEAYAVPGAAQSSGVRKDFGSYVGRRLTGRADSKAISKAEVVPIAGYDEALEQTTPIHLEGSTPERQLAAAEGAVGGRPPAFLLLTCEIVAGDQSDAAIEVVFEDGSRADLEEAAALGLGAETKVPQGFDPAYGYGSIDRMLGLNFRTRDS
jgi:hypothetical protein